MWLYLYKEQFRFSYKTAAFVPYEIRPQLVRWVRSVTAEQEAGFPVTHDDYQQAIRRAVILSCRYK
jgi:hypothetical protein